MYHIHPHPINHPPFTQIIIFIHIPTAHPSFPRKTINTQKNRTGPLTATARALLSPQATHLTLYTVPHHPTTKTKTKKGGVDGSSWTITPGQYYLVSIPAVGGHQWHPFSVAVGKEEQEEESEGHGQKEGAVLSFVVKACGALFLFCLGVLDPCLCCAVLLLGGWGLYIQHVPQHMYMYVWMDTCLATHLSHPSPLYIFIYTVHLSPPPHKNVGGDTWTQRLYQLATASSSDADGGTVRGRHISIKCKYQSA